MHKQLTEFNRFELVIVFFFRNKQPITFPVCYYGSFLKILVYLQTEYNEDILN